MTNKHSWHRILLRVLLYVGLTLAGFIMCVPFFWMLSSSLKPFDEIFVMPIQWIPKHPTGANYEEVFAVSKYVNFPRGFLNTLIVVLPTLIVGLFMSSLAAYGFSRLRFPGRDSIFFCLLATMAIPGIVTLIPSYILYSKLGWIDSWAPLMIPGLFGSAGTVFFTRQYMMGLPKEIEEAAKIDGLSLFQIFLLIDLPLSKPIVITNLLFGFIGGYNDYMGPLLYIQTPEKYTLQLTLSMMNDTFGTKWGVVMAGACIAMIPTVLIFFFAQRFFIEGITLSGMKG